MNSKSLRLLAQFTNGQALARIARELEISPLHFILVEMTALRKATASLQDRPH